MKARKTAREQMAAAHKSVVALKKNVESLMAKRRRLEAKVSNLVKIISSYNLKFVLTIMCNMLNTSSCSIICSVHIVFTLQCSKLRLLFAIFWM